MIQIDVGREVCKLFAQNYSLRGLDFQNKSLRVTEENIVARNYLRCLLFNPLHSNISMYILHTVH